MGGNPENINTNGNFQCLEELKSRQAQPEGEIKTHFYHRTFSHPRSAAKSEERQRTLALARTESQTRGFHRCRSGYFCKQSQSRSTRASQGRLPTGAGLSLQPKTLMHVENLKMEAIAIIKLSKDFAKQYAQRAASGARSRGSSAPAPSRNSPSALATAPPNRSCPAPAPRQPRPRRAATAPGHVSRGRLPILQVCCAQTASVQKSVFSQVQTSGGKSVLHTFSSCVSG